MITITKVENVRNFMKETHNVDILSPIDFKRILSDLKIFKDYIDCIMGPDMDDVQKEQYTSLSYNTRITLLENSMFNIDPLEILVLFILYNIVKESISYNISNVIVIDKPEDIKSFIVPFIKEVNDAKTMNYTINKEKFVICMGKIFDGVSISLNEAVSALTKIDKFVEFISILSEKAIQGIDKRRIDYLIENTLKYNHSDTIKSYSLGNEHPANIIPNMADVSASMYCHNYIGASNIAVINSKTANNKFANLIRKESNNLDSMATWEVYSTDAIEENVILLIRKPSDKVKDHIPYVVYNSCIIVPYPLGNNPSYCGMVRDAQKIIKPNSTGLLYIDKEIPSQSNKSEKLKQTEFELFGDNDYKRELVEKYIEEKRNYENLKSIRDSLGVKQKQDKYKDIISICKISDDCVISNSFVLELMCIYIDMCDKIEIDSSKNFILKNDVFVDSQITDSILYSFNSMNYKGFQMVKHNDNHLKIERK